MNPVSFQKIIPPEWASLLLHALKTASCQQLEQFLDQEYENHTVFPPRDDLFSALRLTLPAEVKVVILGQDPYHDEGQAHGLAFSVRPGIPFPPSLRNIFREYSDDLGLPTPQSGSLIPWAQQGVLLLNTVLSVRAHSANSHKKHGWEDFTDAVISAVDHLPQPVIFVLWGGPAQKKASLIVNPAHCVLTAPHPSPLSSYRGFFGSKPFTKINALLKGRGVAPVNWTLSREE